MSLLEDSIKRLIEGPSYDVVLYLDECGTPATDRRLVTGGVLVYNSAQAVTARWRQYWEQAGLRQKKGRDLEQSELLAVAEFLIGQPVLPVAVWSMLKQEELARLRKFSQKYERSQSRLKRFKKISGASWLWKHQMSQTVACAQAAFIGYMGPIRSATAYIDEMKEEPEKREHYRQLLALHSTSTQLEETVRRIGVPEPIKALLVRSVAAEWQIEMTARGALARMADICCTMFGRYIDDVWRNPWNVIRIRYAVGDSKVVPPWLGLDLTENIRAWLEQLYTHGDPDR